MASSHRWTRKVSCCPYSLSVLTMPTSNHGWPEEFGFQLGGTGPSYILTMGEGSSAHLSGLQPGDQVLEIEGQDVSSLGAQAVIALAQAQKNIPPSIGVVSRIQQVWEITEVWEDHALSSTFLVNFLLFPISPISPVCFSWLFPAKFSKSLLVFYYRNFYTIKLKPWSALANLHFFFCFLFLFPLHNHAVLHSLYCLPLYWVCVTLFLET